MKKNKFNYLNSLSCMLAILLLIATPFEVLADESTYREYVDSNQNVRLVNISQKNFKAGDVTPIVMNFESDKFRYVNELKVTIKSGDDNPGAFTFDTLNESVTLKYFYEDTKVDAFIKISPSLKAGTYPVTFEYEYYDIGERYTGSETINVTVTGRSDKFLYIEGGRLDDVNVGDSNKAQLTVNITNPSDYYYQYVEVYFNSEDSTGFSLYDSFKPVFIEGIFPKETVTATFPVYIDTSVSTGNHPVNLTLNYNSSDWNKMTSIEDIYVEVIRGESSSGGGSSTEGGTPRIIISSYNIDVEQVQAGKDFSLDFGLKNTSNNNAVSNIKVVVSSTTATGSGSSGTSGEVFFPTEGSNSFFIDSIPAGGISTQTIDLMTKQDVEPGVYSVLLKIDYEYGDGQSVSTEEQIAFSVTQEQRLEIQGITPPMHGQMGASMPVSFQFINKGKAIIYNMSVTADGDFEIEGGDSYVGNLPAGYNDYYDAYLIPTKGGECTGAIVLQFEDSVGNPQEVRSEFTVIVDEGFPDMGGGDYGIGGFDDFYDPYIDSMGGINPEYIDEEEETNNTPILIVMILIIGTIGFIVLKQSKAKKLAELEVDEDEDD